MNPKHADSGRNSLLLRPPKGSKGRAEEIYGQLQLEKTQIKRRSLFNVAGQWLVVCL